MARHDHILLSHPLSTHSPRLSDASEHWVPSLTLDGKIILGWITADLEPESLNSTSTYTPQSGTHFGILKRMSFQKPESPNFTPNRGQRNKNLQVLKNQHFNFHVHLRNDGSKPPSRLQGVEPWSDRVQTALSKKLKEAPLEKVFLLKTSPNIQCMIYILFYYFG